MLFRSYLEITPDKNSAELNVCDSIDYSNPKHMKNALLLKPSERISSDFNIIAYDVQNALDTLEKEGKLSEYEIELIDLYRISVSNIDFVAKELNKHRMQIYRDLDKIVAKLIKKIN